MLRLLAQVNSLLNRRERSHLALLLIALVLRAAVELVGVASVMPFMGVAADPDLVHTNQFLSFAYDYLGFESVTAFVSVLGMAVVLLLLIANGFSAVTLYALTRFSWNTHHRIAMRLLKGYLAQPYHFFVQRNSASLSKSLLTECQEVVRGLLQPLLIAASKLPVILAIAVLLVVVEPMLALGAVVLLGGSYGILYAAVRQGQRRLGQIRVKANEERFRVAAEAFGGIKDVKVLQREASFVNRFAPASLEYSKSIASSLVVQQLPRYIFETLAFGGIVLVMVYYLQSGQSLSQALPVLSLYALASYRLMPELQQLFQSLTQIRFSRASLDDVTSDLKSIGSTKSSVSQDDINLSLKRDIQVDQVSFTYPGASKPALDATTLHFKRNQTVGLVGRSGSGKTTLVDLLLGLYEPDEGQIAIDGVPLSPASLKAWRSRVGYVPQHIFLTDDSISANIAFGVSPRDRSDSKVVNAARIAHLHDLIEALPAGYETLVGERGVRLSGGQRQRIGIARALYHDPDVLIMDEATSALDGATENAVMLAIEELAGKKTIILIAHRLTTVKEADNIWLMQDGKIQDVGRYEELLEHSPAFRSIANMHAEQP